MATESASVAIHLFIHMFFVIIHICSEETEEDVQGVHCKVKNE